MQGFRDECEDLHPRDAPERTVSEYTELCCSEVNVRARGVSTALWTS